jgi:hypothetical protein
VAYGINQAIIMPIGEMGMTPHRAYRAVGLPQSLVKKVANKHMAFNILLVSWELDTTLNISTHDTDTEVVDMGQTSKHHDKPDRCSDVNRSVPTTGFRTIPAAATI